MQQLVKGWRIYLLVGVTNKASPNFFPGIFLYSTFYENILEGIKILGIFYRRYCFLRVFVVLPWRCYHPSWSSVLSVYNFVVGDKYSRKFVPAGILNLHKKSNRQDYISYL